VPRAPRRVLRHRNPDERETRMHLKKSVVAAALLAAAVLIAGCGSLLPATPPTEVHYGAVDFAIDLLELDAAEITVTGAGAVLVQGSTVIEHQLTVSGGTATGLLLGVPEGTWQATIDLLDEQDQVLATGQLEIVIQRDSTTHVVLVARAADGQVALEPQDSPGGGDPGDGDPGTGDPGAGDPDPGDDPGPGEPGDDEPGSGD